jgi:cytochrome d ubiquinol oxidase subunit I
MLASTLAMYITLYFILLMTYISVLFYLARKAGSVAQNPLPQLAGSPA